MRSTAASLKGRWLMDSILYLVSKTQTQDEYGAWQTTVSKRQVFAKTRSVSRLEFFQGGRSGLNPEMQFTIFAGDYEGETIVEHNGKTYAVYRTYLPEDSDYIELYVERKGGTNGKTDTD